MFKNLQRNRIEIEIAEAGRYKKKQPKVRDDKAINNLTQCCLI